MQIMSTMMQRSRSQKLKGPGSLTFVRSHSILERPKRGSEKSDADLARNAFAKWRRSSTSRKSLPTTPTTAMSEAPTMEKAFGGEQDGAQDTVSASIAFINRSDSIKVYNNLKNYCAKHGCTLNILPYEKLREEDPEIAVLMLKADLLIVDFGVKGDGALFLSGFIAKRKHGLNFLLFDPDNYYNLLRAEAAIQCAETLRYKKKKKQIIIMSSDGEEKDFGDYLSETISKNVKGRVDRTKDTGFTKALDAARSLKRNKIKELEQLIIQEQLKGVGNLTDETEERLNMVLQMYRQTESYEEMLRLINVLEKNFPTAKSFKYYKTIALAEQEKETSRERLHQSMVLAQKLVEEDDTSMRSRIILAWIYTKIVIVEFEELGSLPGYKSQASEEDDPEYIEIQTEESGSDVPRTSSGEDVILKKLSEHSVVEQREKHLSEFEKHVLKGIECLEEVYKMESMDAEAPPTLAGGLLATLRFCYLMALEERMVSGKQDDQVESLKAKEQKTLLELQVLIAEMNVKVGNTETLLDGNEPFVHQFWDAACFFEINLVGAYVSGPDQYLYVNQAAESLHELWSCDWQLRDCVKTLQLIMQVQTRREMLSPIYQPPVRDNDKTDEKNRRDFNFWCQYFSAIMDCVDGSSRRFPALLVQEDELSDGSSSLIACHVSIEEEVTDSAGEDSTQRHQDRTSLTRSDRSRVSRTNKRKGIKGRPTTKFFKEKASNYFIQIVHAFDNTRYAIPLKAGLLFMSNHDVPNQHRQQTMDCRRMILSVIRRDGEGESTQVCTLLFCSPLIRKAFSDLCARCGYKTQMSKFENVDTKTNKDWSFVNGPDGKRIMLGKGSFARVFQGTMGRSQIAIKELINYDVPSIVTSFKSEIRTLSQLHHKNIIKIFGWDEAPGTGAPCILLDLVPGGSLKDLLEIYGTIWIEGQPESESVIAWYAIQLCRAVDYLHGKQIMSRDIKDENCLVNKFDGTVVLIDFGTNKEINSLQPVSSTFVGTPTNMSQNRINQEGYGLEEDIYSVGCVVRQLVTETPIVSQDLSLSEYMKLKSKAQDNVTEDDWPTDTKKFIEACMAPVILILQIALYISYKKFI
eukprot:m.149295 g.149295  ORF g.149295 m.149295 type:complete len:1087 (-) comp15010_c0_seq1:1523-4783(-)